LKILLVQTPTGRMEKPIYPLGLAHLAGAIKDEHEVLAFDPAFNRQPLFELKKKIIDFKPDAICLSLRNIDSGFLVGNYWYYHALTPTLDAIRSTGFDRAIVIGGAAFTLFARQIMEEQPQIDIGLVYEAENTLPKLLKNLDQLNNVPSALWRNDNTIIENPLDTPPDLHYLPRAAYDIVDPSPYCDIPFAVGVQSKRGCALKCSYCTYPYLERGMRLRPPEEVVAEVEALAKLGVRDFALVDSEFGKPRDHALSIAHALTKAGSPLRFSVWLSEDECDSEMIDALWNAGLHHIEFSPDAYDDRMLSMIGKTIKTSDIDQAISNVERHGKAAAAINFFVGSPGESISTFRRKIKLRGRIKAGLRERYAGFGLAVIRIYPHTELYKRSIQENFLDENTNLLHKAVHYYKGFPVTLAFKMLLWIRKLMGKDRVTKQNLSWQ
jgi:anaerobic magnesium-protoporphyrin IX monomethyl ester cyclase